MKVSEKMMQELNKSRYGKCRMEFFAVKPLVESLLAEGYTILAIYKALKSEGKITMTYEWFWRNARNKFKSRAKQKEIKNQNVEVKVLEPSTEASTPPIEQKVLKPIKVEKENVFQDRNALVDNRNFIEDAKNKKEQE